MDNSLRILVVDDHKDTLRSLKILLTQLGYDVTSAENVADALRLSQETKFDLLLSDIGLPDGSGLDLMKKIHEHQGINGIALSGFGMDEDIQRSREAGFSEHLTKPISLDRLHSAIRLAAPTLQ